MLIKGTEGYVPFQNNAVRPAVSSGSRRAQKQDSCYDRISLAAPAEQENHSFIEAVAGLSRQIRTTNTTGKIQELHRQVSSGEYQVSPREVAARMLLMAEGE